MQEKVVGILGGMGPASTLDLFCKIIEATPAIRDQDHLRIIIDNNPKIPDRTEAILHGKMSPLPELLKTARNLQRAGADFIAIPCNTAHYYYKELTNSIEVPILNLIQITANALIERLPRARKAGLLASSGTVESNIYAKALEKFGIRIVYPPSNLQKEVMNAIYNIKAGKLETGKKKILKIAKYLVQRKIDVVIAGCTEISLALQNEDLQIPVVDPMQILAEVIVSTALGQT